MWFLHHGTNLTLDLHLQHCRFYIQIHTNVQLMYTNMLPLLVLILYLIKNTRRIGILRTFLGFLLIQAVIRLASQLNCGVLRSWNHIMVYTRLYHSNFYYLGVHMGGKSSIMSHCYNGCITCLILYVIIILCV